MTNLTHTRPAEPDQQPITGQAFGEWVDPGWSHRRDAAVAVVGAAMLVGVGCGVVLGWLGWAGAVLAVGLYLAWLRLMLALLGRGGSR